MNSGGEIALPPLHEFDGAEDIASALMMAGPTEPGAMSELPLSWQSLATWAALTEAHLSPGEFEDVRRLSEIYLAACDEYRHKSTPPPWNVVEINRRLLAKEIRAAFRLGRPKKGKVE